MSGNTDQPTNLISGIIIGFISFAVFGLVTMAILWLAKLETPTDRIVAGDFSENTIERRSFVATAARQSQEAAFDETKVAAAMSAFKAAPQSASSEPVPNAAPAPAPVVKKPEPAAEPKPAATPKPKPKPAAKQPEAKKPEVKNSKPAAKARPKGARAKKGKATGEAKPKSNNKGKAKAAPKPDGQ